MLTITVPATEYYDEIKEEFINIPEQKLELEHSLVSLSKWEAKWNKAFLGHKEKTKEELSDYIRCMTVNEVDPMVYTCLTNENHDAINEYINAKMSATYIHEKQQDKGGSEVVTSELIYYWMISLQIPFECQHWHLNRLLTLIQVCNIKNSSGTKKMSKRDIMAQNDAINAARRAKFNTKG